MKNENFDRAVNLDDAEIIDLGASSEKTEGVLSPIPSEGFASSLPDDGGF
jgi:hypothetical protein